MPACIHRIWVSEEGYLHVWHAGSYENTCGDNRMAYDVFNEGGEYVETQIIEVAYTYMGGVPLLVEIP